LAGISLDYPEFSGEKIFIRQNKYFHVSEDLARSSHRFPWCSGLPVNWGVMGFPVRGQKFYLKFVQ
jgi:hypothetical protein